MSLKFALGIATFVIAYHFGMRYILTYRFSDVGVLAVLFGVLSVSIANYDRVEAVRINSYGRVLFGFVLWVPNRLMGSFVLIRGKSGLPVLITPEHPQEFLRELQRRVYERTGVWPLAS